MENWNPPKRECPQILEGIVIPTEWNERGIPTHFSLYAFDDKEYQMDCRGSKGIEFGAFIRKKVRLVIDPFPEDHNGHSIASENIISVDPLEDEPWPTQSNGYIR